MTDEAAIGRRERREDVIAPWRAEALHGVLDLDGPPPRRGDALPAFQHWIYFLDATRGRDLGRDGHPAKTGRGGLVPDLGLPRRMWAGGGLTFHAPLPIGAEAVRETTLESVARKSGRSGPLAFVTLRHEIRVEGALCVSERQDLVYREDPAPGAPAPDPIMAPGMNTGGEARSRAHRLGPVMLFRYSALTFNGHRIHYDRDYARDVEGYPGLVVHGPLIAQLLLGLAEEGHGPAASFEFRARSPAFDFEEITICAADSEQGGSATGATLCAKGPDGRLLMTGETRAAAGLS